MTLGSRVLLGLAAFVVSIGILALAIPRLGAGLARLPGDKVLQTLAPGAAPDAATVRVLEDSRRKALLWHRQPVFLTDLAQAHLLQARALGPGETPQTALLLSATGLLRNGLALAPANSFAWLRLAHIQHLLAGPSQTVADALRLSVITAPYQTEIIFPRLQLLFRVLPRLTPVERGLLDQQVMYAWQISVVKTLQAAERHGVANFVEDVLTRHGDAGDLETFTTQLGYLRNARRPGRT